MPCLLLRVRIPIVRRSYTHIVERVRPPRRVIPYHMGFAFSDPRAIGIFHLHLTQPFKEKVTIQYQRLFTLHIRYIVYYIKDFECKNIWSKSYLEERWVVWV